MDQKSFEKLADQAASGLKSDSELFLDVKQELLAHLEDEAERFACDGRSDDESVDLARRSFGSPLDVAAELLEANRQRMTLRAVLRLAFGALIVPLAIVASLYVGYWRVARGTTAMSALPVPGASARSIRLPVPPFFRANVRMDKESAEILTQLADKQGNAESIRKYWKNHRQHADSRMYYAYYTMFLKPEIGQPYVDAMRVGQQVEPANALYNINLADYYLKRGMLTQLDKRTAAGAATTNNLLDRSAFELGLAELHAAAKKPYLRTYQSGILRKKLNALPRPAFMEDYLQHTVVLGENFFRNPASYRNLARKIPGCARILISEGHNAEAEAVMDTWRPYVMLLLGDVNYSLSQELVINAVGSMLAKHAPAVYDELGADAKAKDARAVYGRLRLLSETWKNGEPKQRKQKEQFIRRHSSTITSILMPVIGETEVTEKEMKPGRMQEHVMLEECIVQGLLVLLVLALIGAILEGVVWSYRLRRAAAVPLLLMTPARQMLRVLGLGIILPLAIYWIYSRLPIVGGREFALWSAMLPRFVAEWCVLALVILWVPVRIMRFYVRRRCEDLDIPIPKTREEASTDWKVRGAMFATLGVAAVAVFVPGNMSVSPAIRICAAVLAVGILALIARYTARERGKHGLYYGALARSLTPVYALSIILISLTVQPWLLHSEAMWLQNDKLVIGSLADNQAPGAYSGLETKAARYYSDLLREAIKEGKK